MYSIGQRFILRGEEYILAQVERHAVVLIGLHSANRWHNPVSVCEIYNISREEMYRILGNESYTISEEGNIKIGGCKCQWEKSNKEKYVAYRRYNQDEEV